MADEQTENTEHTEDGALDLGGLNFGDDLVIAGDTTISWLKVLGYGPSGTGKTSLFATMPEPILILLTEKQGEMSIRRVNPRARIVYIEDKIICKCHGKTAEKCPNGARDGIEKLTAKQVLYGVLDELATKTHPFLSVGLDSLTDLQQVFLSDMKGGQPGKKVSLPEWGSLIDYTKDVIIKLRNLNMHSGVICLSDEIQDNNNRLVYRPQLAGKKLPSAILQFFNLVCFQRKMRDADAVGGATYESVFDAGDEYYTKTHPALAPIEVPLFRLWVDKIAKYALDNNQGQMPTASSKVSGMTKRKTENDVFKQRIEQPKIKALFDELDAPEAKRLSTADKYRSDLKLIEILEKRVAEKKALQDKEAAEKRAADIAKNGGEVASPPAAEPSVEAPAS